VTPVVVAPRTPALVVGTVAHTRRTPVERAFRHAHYQWLVDVDELPDLPWPTRMLARFDPGDHLDHGRQGGGIRGDLDRFLAGRGIRLDRADRVLMLAHARVLGHTFDPLTVFWCLAPDGAVKAAVFEVHNTYGERHAYLLAVDGEGHAEVEKTFYVSPFNDVTGRYDVRLHLSAERVTVSVGLDRGGERVLTAVATGSPLPGTARSLLRVFSRHLFMTHRVSLLIRWHGVRLWLARLPILPRPVPTEEAVR
jgi:hypothetical protein